MKFLSTAKHSHVSRMYWSRCSKQPQQAQSYISQISGMAYTGAQFCDVIPCYSYCCSNQVKNSTDFKRFYGTRTNKPLSSQHTANQFVRWLLPEERATLLSALKEFEAEDGVLKLDEDNEPDPTLQQLRLVALCNAIPFVGFGLLDNGIMILAGEYIDHTIGVTLGISTMAAAAVGNLISDIMGLGLAGYVEAIATRFGFEAPAMSTRQASMWKTKYSAYFGRGIGIAIGCVLGMFPLLFIDPVDDEEKEHLKNI